MFVSRSQDGAYTGDLKDGEPHGQGVMIYDGSNNFNDSNYNYNNHNDSNYNNNNYNDSNYNDNNYNDYNYNDNNYNGNNYTNNNNTDLGIGVLAAKNYSGSWRNGLRHGSGAIFWSNGDK